MSEALLVICDLSLPLVCLMVYKKTICCYGSHIQPHQPALEGEQM